MIGFTYFLIRPLLTVENHTIDWAELEDPFIVVINHNNSFEVLVIAAYLLKKRGAERIAFLIDWMFGEIPLLKWLFSFVDPIYIYNKKARIGILNRRIASYTRGGTVSACVHKIQNWKSVALFPEGTRNRDPFNLRKGRLGAAHIILATTAPVIPIGVDFRSRIRKRRIPRLGKIILRIGPPMDFIEERELLISEQNKPNSDMKRTRHQIAARITHIIMTRLSDLSGKSYPFAWPTDPVPLTT